MNLNSLELSKAQSLLLELVWVLSPIAGRAVPISFFLNNRFSPKSGDSQLTQFRYPVRLITTLHSMQKQVEEWIEVNGELGTQNAERRTGNGELLGAAESSEAGERREPGCHPDPLNAERRSQNAKLVGEPPAPPKAKLPPLSRLAQRLIDQVQDAIGKLCQSTNIKDPKEEPLREALKRLKPELDQIIKSVSHEGMHSADEGLPQVFRPIPRPARENLIKMAISQEGVLKKERETISRSSVESPAPLPQIDGKSSQEKESATPRSVERTTLSAAPFVPETRNLTPGQKKKKRKSFWFREEKEERNNS